MNKGVTTMDGFSKVTQDFWVEHAGNYKLTIFGRGDDIVEYAYFDEGKRNTHSVVKYTPDGAEYWLVDKQ